MVLLSKDRSLTDEEFNRLLSVCNNSDQPYEDKFLVYGMGKLGFRIGEITHLKDTWVDSQSSTVNIPLHDPCTCSYCVAEYLKKKKLKSANLSDVCKTQWEPKTTQGSRSVPFDFDPDIADVIKYIMNKYTKNPFSYAQIRFRIRTLAKITRILDLSPHGLRATAATFFARDGMKAYHLTTIMGWHDIAIANHYVKMHGMDTKTEIDRIYGKNRIIEINPRIEYHLTEVGEKIISNQIDSHDMKRLRLILASYNVNLFKSTRL